MRKTLLASAAGLSLALAVPAMAQSVNAPASNVIPSDTHSTIAPALPTPPVGENGSPREFLRAASTELGQNRAGEAQEALERAESRLLDRSTANPEPGVDRAPMIRQINAARDAIGHGDLSGAKQIVDAELATPPRGGNAAPVAAAQPMSAPSAGMAAGATGGTGASVGQAPASVVGPETSATGQVGVTTNGGNGITTTKRREGTLENTGPGMDTARQ